jgi:hypothetical protein
MLKRNFLVIIGAALLLTLYSCGGNSNQSDLKLIPVKSGDKWGYINKKGEYQINPQFKDADFFHDGLAYVVSEDGKTGYISEDGKYKIPAEFKDGTPFKEGLAFVVSDGGVPICIDKSGKTKFELKEAKYVFWFSEGLAVFMSHDDKTGFVDKSGKVVINAQFESAGAFSEGLAHVRQEGKSGFIDKSGKIVINLQFDGADDFHAGKAAFKNGNQVGFIDKKGSYVINPQFDLAAQFCEGLAAIKSGKQWGYITEDGKIEINPQFEDASSFKGGLAQIEQGRKYGFITKQGKIEINPQFDLASSFFNDIAFVKSANKWGIIDKKGKYLVNPLFDDMKWYEGQYYVKSDYYDASAFISKFFERAKGNSFDGFDASSTLQTITDNATYGNGASGRYNDEHAVDYKKSQKLTDDISISQVSFHSDHENQFYTGSYYNKEYNFGAKFYGMQYKLSLSGEARSKSMAITNALIEEIEKRYGIKLKYSTDESGDSDYDWYEGTNETFEFTIIPMSDKEIEFYLNFKQ